jgi:phenylpropionate dioxygenase-like ring-hydroxylating dioxygenase large terminal subunit
MARFPKPPEGSWTEHYPDLGTGPVSYEDSIDPEFFEVERKAVFKRAWLNVGRVEQLPRKGSYFTKEMKVVNTSIIVVRTASGKRSDGGIGTGEVKAYHNICRHRGNKLVWNDMPLEETSGVCRQFTCKYHAWRYDLDGNLTFVQQEGEFFDLDKSRYGLVDVHCEVWEGFIFVNFAAEPEQTLHDFLGPMITNLAGYPFGRMTSRFHYRSEVKANWKLYMDAFQEFYHAPVLHANQSPTAYSKAAAEAGFEAPHYRIEGPHRLVSTSGVRAWEMADEMRKPIEDICQSGLFGPWDAQDLGEMPVGLNPAKCDPWGLDSFQLFPNFVILFWGQGWYLTYHYWPLTHNTHLFEGTVYFPEPRTARERIAQELAAVSFKEYGLQDANTLEATQSMIESRVLDDFVLCDQEVLIRHLHKETAAWVEDYRRKQAVTVP